MTAAFVVDTSIAVKWLVPEPDSERASELRRFSLSAPDLLRAECANVLWRLVRVGALPEQEAFDSLQDLADGTIRFWAGADLEADALRIAFTLDHPVYDCYFLALAERNRAPLITDDRRLIRAARRHDRFRALALLLDDVSSLRP